MDVSIIIVNWNTRDFLRDCLRSIYGQTEGVSFEVIVVDNASSDRSASMIREEFPRAMLIENAENRGFAAANNQGLAMASGRYLLLLNPDTLILDHAIEKTIRFAESRPDVGVVGCKVMADETRVQRTCFRFPSVLGLTFQESGLSRLFPRSHVFGKTEIGWWDRDTELEVDVVSGMYMLVRREAFLHIGPMDEDYFVYAEETDWCYRFHCAGWRCVFTPTASIIHRDGGSKSTDQISAKMFVQKQKSLLIYYRKHLGHIRWSAAKAVYVVSMFVRTALWYGTGKIGFGKASRHKFLQSKAALRFHLFSEEPGS
jgi:GT2 family glycosyltransferase